MICQECGERIGPNEKHNYFDCGEHHLVRATEILAIYGVKVKIEICSPPDKEVSGGSDCMVDTPVSSSHGEASSEMLRDSLPVRVPAQKPKSEAEENAT